MATLTKNLFWGQGERDHRLDVVEGHWPDDVNGSVVIVGPDKRAPGGHWFGEQGLLEKIRLVPDGKGRIQVEHRRVETTVQRIRRWLPFLFANVEFAEVSPFGVSNLANTNVLTIGGRMFLGYDAGRPVEIDPETLRHLTPVGSNREWLQSVPGVLEPLCAVAAHAASDEEAGCLWFVNYTQISPPDVAAPTYIARWDLEGPVQRWRVTGMSPFDSIHDVKVTENHVVFTDLPFVVEPEMIQGAPRATRNQDHTKLWIVAKADLEAHPPGTTVRAREVRIPMPTGHLFADFEEIDGLLRIVLQQIPLSDLMLTIGDDSVSHATGETIDPDYRGLIALSVQPSVLGTYLIDPAAGEVVRADLAIDEERVWGGLLIASDTSRPEARAHQRQVWSAGVGFDPDLVSEDWWSLYGDATDGLVAPANLPTSAIPGALARIDVESAKVAEVWSYERGAFPSPPTFVPRRGATDPDDGYIVVVVHQDGDKEIQIFDAAHIAAGPLARATAPHFNPPLLLHSCWAADRVGRRPSTYHVTIGQDVAGALAALPGVFASMMRMGKAITEAKQLEKKAGAKGAASRQAP